MKRSLSYSILVAIIVFFNFNFEAKAELVEGFLKQGNYRQAGITLRNTVDFNLTDRKTQIRLARLCWDKGFEILEKNKVAPANYLIKIACEADTSLYKKTCDKAINSGEKMFRTGQYARGSYFLDLAYNYNQYLNAMTPDYQKIHDPNLGKIIATILFEASASVKNDPVAQKALLAKACRYDPVYTGELNDQILVEYQNKPRQERKRIIDQFSAYLSEETKKLLLPEPVWVKIPETYDKLIGHGTEGGKNNLTGKGLTLEKGWRVVALAKNDIKFHYYFEGSYKPFLARFILPVRQTIRIKNGLGFRIPKGEVVEFWVEKLVYH